MIQITLNTLMGMEQLFGGKKSQIIQLPQNSTIESMLHDLRRMFEESFKDYEIDYQTINMLKEYTNNNYQKIEKEIDKLKMLKFDEKKITKEDIKEVTLKDFDTNIFDFLKAINNIFPMFFFASFPNVRHNGKY